MKTVISDIEREFYKLDAEFDLVLSAHSDTEDGKETGVIMLELRKALLAYLLNKIDVEKASTANAIDIATAMHRQYNKTLFFILQ